MRIGMRTALAGMVLACVFASAGPVHLAWRAVADANSRALAEALSAQAAARVRDELGARLGEAEAAHAALRTILAEAVIDSREADRREFVFLAQMQAQPSLSWIAFAWPDGGYFAAHRLGDRGIEMIEIDAGQGPRRLRRDRYRLFREGTEFVERSFERSAFEVRDQPWFAPGPEPAWLFVNRHPSGKRGAIAFSAAVRLHGREIGVLATMVELGRLSRFLGRLDLGPGGGAFLLSGDGSIVAGPDREADEVRPPDFSRHPLLPAAAELGRRIADGLQSNRLALEAAGVRYRVDLASAGFRDWRIAVIVPEAQHLGMVEAATMRLGAGLAVFLLAAAAASVLAAGRLIGRPISAVAGELARVGRLELDGVAYRRSRLAEIDALSMALARTATGLGAFQKYLPRDLVRKLVDEGVSPVPGGELRPLTVLFADVAGFTGLAERLGPEVVPLIGRFLELAAESIEAEGGTVDKFIGDAVMAFWGAPHADPDHAYRACRAALRLQRALATSGLRDDLGASLVARIGIQSGLAVVGNVGSELRLNYTALGDTVNTASRIETINKLYGTGILVGEATRTLVGSRAYLRELDTVAVYGRAGAITLFELLGVVGDEPPRDWVAAYERALGRYRAGAFAEAAEGFARAAALRGGDAAAELLGARARLLAASRPDDWQPVHVLDSKMPG